MLTPALKKKTINTIIHTVVLENEAIGRSNEIRRLEGYIRSNQSCALVGIFDEERMEILTYLWRSNMQSQVHSDKSFLFSRIINISVYSDYSENVREHLFWIDSLSVIESIDIEENIKKSYDEYKIKHSQRGLLEIIKSLQMYNYIFVLLVDRFENLILSNKESFGLPIIQTLRLCISVQTPSNFIAILGMRIPFSWFEFEFFSPHDKYIKYSALLTSIQTNSVVLKPFKKEELEKSLFSHFSNMKKNQLSKVAEYFDFLTGRHLVFMRILFSVLRKRNIIDATVFIKQIDSIKEEFIEDADIVYSLLLRQNFSVKSKLTSLQDILKNDSSNTNDHPRKELLKLGIVIRQSENKQKPWRLNPILLESILNNEN